jgi:putative DNA primase/helicase
METIPTTSSESTDAGGEASAVRTLPDGATIPEELRGRRQWVAYRLESSESKPGKIPVNPTTGRNASATNPDDWTDFDTAIEAVALYDLEGVGFVFTAEAGIVGIDLDECMTEAGELVPEVTPIIESFRGTYMEISPSCRGIHIFAMGKKPVGVGCKKMNMFGCKCIEVYDRERYFTVTGQRYRLASGGVGDGR